MNEDELSRPTLPRHVRYRWDDIRKQHQLVYPEGILVLNETGAAIVRLCDGRLLTELIAALRDQFPDIDPTAEVREFLERLARKGLLRE